MATAGEAVSMDAFHEVLTSFGYGPSSADDNDEEDDCSSEQVDNGLNGVTEEPDGVEGVDSGSSSRVQVDGISPFSSVSWRPVRIVASS